MSSAGQQILAVVGCRQLVTLRGPARARVGPEMAEIGIIANGAMLVRDGRIVQVGPERELRKSIDAA